MGYEDIEKRVRHDYEVQIQEIRSQQEREKDQILAKIKAEADTEYEKAHREGVRHAELVRRQLIAQAKLAASRDVAAAENHAMDEVYAECGKRIKALDKDGKKKLLKRFLKDVQALEGDVIVKVAKGDSDLVGKGYEVVEEDIEFGAILESKDVPVRVDNRAHNVLSRTWERTKPEVKKILFK